MASVGQWGGRDQPGPGRYPFSQAGSFQLKLDSRTADGLTDFQMIQRATPDTKAATRDVASRRPTSGDNAVQLLTIVLLIASAVVGSGQCQNQICAHTHGSCTVHTGGTSPIK